MIIDNLHGMNAHCMMTVFLGESLCSSDAHIYYTVVEHLLCGVVDHLHFVGQFHNFIYISHMPKFTVCVVIWTEVYFSLVGTWHTVMTLLTVSVTCH